MGGAACKYEDTEQNEHPFKGEVAPPLHDSNKGKWNQCVGKRNQTVWHYAQPDDLRPPIKAVSMRHEIRIQQLPEKQRIVFNMKYFDDMKYEDMSEVLGTSVGALKASYHHAVKKIEKYLEVV